MATLHIEHVMGTAVSIDVRDTLPNSAAVVAEVVAWLHHVDETFSTYITTSPLSRFGLGEIGFSDLSIEVLEVLGLCEEVREHTQGAFDITVVPAPNGSSLDPSGLVKGWSLERAADIIERRGGRNFCLNAGGDVVVRGRPTSHESWTIGIRNPTDAAQLVDVVHVVGTCAIATSGSYERGAHIIDPETGDATTELASVTVVGPDLTFADAYATALYVSGERGIDWLVGRLGYDAMLLRRDLSATSTAGYRALRSQCAA
jgi:FAD:protein FMN transferase